MVKVQDLQGNHPAHKYTAGASTYQGTGSFMPLK